MRSKTKNNVKSTDQKIKNETTNYILKLNFIKQENYDATCPMSLKYLQNIDNLKFHGFTTLQHKNYHFNEISVKTATHNHKIDRHENDRQTAKGK